MDGQINPACSRFTASAQRTIANRPVRWCGTAPARLSEVRIGQSNSG